MSKMIFINLCLSDIPKDKIVKAKNGKSYVDLVVGEMNRPFETPKITYTHYVMVSKKKEERDGHSDFVGNAYERSVGADRSKEPASIADFAQSVSKPKTSDDLPF